MMARMSVIHAYSRSGAVGTYMAHPAEPSYGTVMRNANGDLGMWIAGNHWVSLHTGKTWTTTRPENWEPAPEPDL